MRSVIFFSVIIVLFGIYPDAYNHMIEKDAKNLAECIVMFFFIFLGMDIIELFKKNK